MIPHESILKQLSTFKKIKPGNGHNEEDVAVKQADSGQEAHGPETVLLV